MKKIFEPTFESLYNRTIPEWFRDCKLGFWSHWGLQSVPMAGDWYARNMYIQGSKQYLYHMRHYGHPSKFGYKDLIPLWKAEKFDPMALMERYVDAGARYFMAQAVHHDHFFNYKSALQPRFNSVNMGPGKDICALWQQAAKAFKLPFGISEHLAGTYTWYGPNKGCDSYGPYAGVPYDGRDPAYEELYTDNYEHYYPFEPTRIDPWMTNNPKWQKRWSDLIHELVDTFHPDMIYSDNPFVFTSADAPYALDACAHLYNDSIDQHGENNAVYCIKGGWKETHGVGIQEVERGVLSSIQSSPWQTDTCIGGWFYDAQQTYKTPSQVIDMFVDIISKNGCLMLNIPQLPDGTIDDEAGYLLDELAGYTKTCGEAIYGTRPYRVFGEGSASSKSGDFCEDSANWKEGDLRFTAKDKNLYVHIMKIPGKGVLTVNSLASNERVKRARLLGGGTLAFEQYADRVCIRLPEKMPTKYVNCVALELE